MAQTIEEMRRFLEVLDPTATTELLLRERGEDARRFKARFVSRTDDTLTVRIDGKDRAFALSELEEPGLVIPADGPE